MANRVTRRGFLQSGATAAVLGLLTRTTTVSAAENSTAAPSPLPMRDLGKTGIKVPLLGIGTAQSGIVNNVENGAKFFEKALELGITYYDSAPELGGYGKAQLQLGEAFKDRRKEVFLTTKCYEPKADAAMKLLEKNLKEMKTDYADLVYLHSLGADKMDPSVVTAPGGVMEFLEKAKREGLAKFVGISGHNRPDRFVPIIKNYDVDVIMTAVSFVDRNTYNFEEKVWPVAAERKVALVAMKVFGGTWGSKDQNSRLPVEHHELALRYALGLPNLSCCVLGMKAIDEVKRNIEWVKKYRPLDSEERAILDTLGKQIAAEWKEHLGKSA